VSRKAGGVREMGKSHKKLDVWQAAMKSTTMIYKLTNKFPEEEKFGLVSQKHQAGFNILCNIACPVK